MRKAVANSTNGVDVVKKMLICILALSSLLEILFFPSWANLLGIVVSWLSAFIYFDYVLMPDFIRRYPLLVLVSIMLFGFMYMPLPITLIDGVSMSHDMYNPELTFILQFIYFAVFILSLRAAAYLSTRYKNLNGIFHSVGFFKIPSVNQTYLLAAFGWFFQLQRLNSQFSGEGNYVAMMGTYAMFSIFIYAPVINIFRELLGARPCSTSQKYIVWVYIFFLSISMIATNSRGAMLSCFMVLGFCFVLKIFTSENTKITWLTSKNLLIGAIAIYLVTGPFNDMSYAMLIARGERKNSNYKELFSKTFEYYKNKQLINKFRLSLEGNVYLTSDWNESYVSNVFLQRFCNYRVVDASIYHAFRAGIPNDKMTSAFYNFTMANLPQPIVNILDKGFKKEKYDYSSMDLLYSIGSHRAIHKSYIVGGDVGLGLSMFGWFFFPIIFVVYVIQLYIIASFVNCFLRRRFFSILTLIGVSSLFITFQVGGGPVVHTNYILWSCWWSLLWKLLVYRIILLIRI